MAQRPKKAAQGSLRAIDRTARSQIGSILNSIKSRDSRQIRARDAAIFSDSGALVVAAPVSRLGDVAKGAVIGVLHLESKEAIYTRLGNRRVPSGTYLVYSQMAGGCGSGDVILRRTTGRQKDIRIPITSRQARIGGMGSTHECKKIINVVITIDSNCICISWDCDKLCHVPICFCWRKRRDLVA